MGAPRRITAAAAATVVLAGVTAAPAEAIGPKRNSSTIVFGHWYSKHRSKWSVETVNAKRDWARICNETNKTLRANVRIAILDSNDHQIGYYTRDNMRFEYHTGCARLTLPKGKHGKKAHFRINVKKDGHGEKDKWLGFKS